MGNGCSSVGERGVVGMVGMVGTVGTVGRCDRTLRWAGLGWPIVGELWVGGAGWARWVSGVSGWRLAVDGLKLAPGWLDSKGGPKAKGERVSGTYGRVGFGARYLPANKRRRARRRTGQSWAAFWPSRPYSSQLTRARSRPLPDPACSLNSRCHSRNPVITATWTPPPYGPRSLSAHSLTLARHDATADADQSCRYLRSSPVATTTNPLTTMVSFRPL